MGSWKFGVSCGGVLLEFGTLVLLVRAVQSRCKRSESLFCVASNMPELFQVGAGLHQTPPPSPTLFTIFIDRISRCGPGVEGVRFGVVRLSFVLYVDDGVLLVSVIQYL